MTVQSNLSGGDVISVGSGFALAAPVPPGQHSVDFAYTFPYQGGQVAYRNSLPQGANIFQILVPDRWENIEISGLDSRPPVGIQEGVYRAWEGRGIPAGPGVELRIDGLPQPGVLTRIGGTLSGGSFWLTAIPSAMGAALLSLLVLGLLRRYHSVPSPSGGGLEPAPHLMRGWGRSPQRSAIVSALAELDESYQDGELDEADYLNRRTELVALALGEPAYANENYDSENDGADSDEESSGRDA